MGQYGDTLGKRRPEYADDSGELVGKIIPPTSFGTPGLPLLPFARCDLFGLVPHITFLTTPTPTRAYHTLCYTTPSLTEHPQHAQLLEATTFIGGMGKQKKKLDP